MNQYDLMHDLKINVGHRDKENSFKIWKSAYF